MHTHCMRCHATLAGNDGVHWIDSRGLQHCPDGALHTPQLNHARQLGAMLASLAMLEMMALPAVLDGAADILTGRSQ